MLTEDYIILISISFLINIQTFVKTAQKDMMCFKISQKIEYRDVNIRRIYKMTKYVESSEKFQKLASAYSESSTRGGGGNIGFAGFSLGMNAEVQSAWSESQSSEIKGTRFRSKEEIEDTTFASGSRQLFKKVTVEMKVSMKKPNKIIQAGISKYVEDNYVGSIDEIACPNNDEEKLVEKARREVKELSKGKQDVKIEGTYGTKLTEERCSEERKN